MISGPRPSMNKVINIATILLFSACAGSTDERSTSEVSGRDSAERIRRIVAAWADTELGWSDYRIDIDPISDKAGAQGWMATINRLPETPGDHVTLLLDGSERIVSTHFGR